MIAALVAIASVVAGRERAEPEPHEVAASALATNAERADTGQAVLDLERLKRPQSSEPIPNLFAPPAEPARPEPAPMRSAATPAAPAAPEIPALPFAYLGRIVDGGSTAVFLSQGDRNFSVEAGQKIDANYQLAQIDENALTLIHLPSGTRQVLQIPPRN
jgi:hypothetical protein